MTTQQSRIALFIDFENFLNGIGKGFKMKPIMQQLTEKGVVSIRKAYGDWHRYEAFRSDLVENGVEMIEQPSLVASGKNGADIKLSIDAIETAFHHQEIGKFIIASGDSDFDPLIRKLREYGRYVVVMSSKRIAAPIMQKNCDEFISCEIFSEETVIENDLTWAIDVFKEAIRIREENGELLDIPEQKNRMMNIEPTFSERLFGYSTFTSFVEAIIDEAKLPYHIERNPKSTVYYIVRNGTSLGLDPKNSANSAIEKKENTSPKRDMTPEEKDENREETKAKNEEIKTEDFSVQAIPKEQWNSVIVAVKKCIDDGEGKFLKGKRWIIFAYLNKQKELGLISFDKRWYKPVLETLAKNQILVRVEQDVYHIAEDWEQKKDKFIESIKN